MTSYKLPLSLLTIGPQGPRIASSLMMKRYNISGKLLREPKTMIPSIQMVREADRANGAWLMFATAIGSILPTAFVNGFDPAIPEDRQTAEGLCLIYDWFFRTFITRGYQALAKDVKNLKDYNLWWSLAATTPPPKVSATLIGSKAGKLGMPWARGHLAFLTDPTGIFVRKDSKMLAHFQLYLLGKALPVPGAEKIRPTLEQHRKDYSQTGENPYLEGLAKDWTQQWFDNLLALSNKGEPKLVDLSSRFGAGSTLTSTRGVGGKDADSYNDVKPYCEGYTLIHKTRSTLWSVFGEAKVDSALCRGLPTVEGNPNAIRFPNKWLYLSAAEAEVGMNNEAYLARDIAMSRLNKRGYFSMPTFPGMTGGDPFLGCFLSSEAWSPDTDVPHVYDSDRVIRVTKIIPVMQRGDKVRPINISDWEITFLGHYVRDYLYQITSFDSEIPTLSDGGAGSAFMRRCEKQLSEDSFAADGIKLKDVFSEMNMSVRQQLAAMTILSLDLSRCSDLITGALSNGFMKGAYTGSRASQSKFLYLVWLLNNGPRRITYDGYPIEEISQEFGPPMMGDPPTWWMDCAYTRFACMLAKDLCAQDIDISACVTHLDLSTTLKSAGYVPNWDFSPGLRVRCGDDEISLGTAEEHQAVLDIYAKLGGKVSEGTAIISNLAGVYCEGLLGANLRNCLSPRQALEWIDIVRIKSISSPEARRMDSESEVPVLWTRGRAASSAIEWFGPDSPQHKFVSALLWHEQHSAINSAYELGIQCFLSAELGGLSYPAHPETAWGRASCSVKSYLRALSTYDPSGTDTELLTLLAEQSAMFTASVGGNPFADVDRIRILDIILSAIAIGGITTFDALCRNKAKNPLEWPAKTWKANSRPFDTGDGEEWLSIGATIKRVRMRLIANHGIVAPNREVRVKHNSDLGKLFGSNCNAIVKSIADLTQQPAAAPESVGALIAAASATVKDAMSRVFINQSIVEDLIPDLCVKPKVLL